MQDEQLHGMEPTRRNSARNRKALVVGFALSALVHGLLLGGWRTTGPEATGSLAAGQRMGEFRAAAGGGAMVAISIAAPRPIIIPAPPARQLRIVDPEVATQEPEQRILPVELAGPSGGARLISDHSGPGLPGADGGGDGGFDATGRDRRTVPTPRSIIPLWNPPKEVRGMVVTIRVLVDARGKPTGEILVQPRIPNPGFARRLRKEMLSMDYVPARRGGRAVAEWAEVTLTF